MINAIILEGEGMT